MDAKQRDMYFFSLIASVSAAVWQAIGKIPNPVSNKIEINLESARMSIDMLDMLKEKTKGNLTPEEDKFITGTIADLQLNYIDTVKNEALKGKDAPKPEAGKEPPKEIPAN